MRKCIVCTPSVRPRLFEQVLTHLKQCRGIENYLLINSIDNQDEEIRHQAESIDFCETQNHFNRIRANCEYNTFKSLSLGFEVSDYVIHIEEDILLAKDALEYFEHCYNFNRFQDIGTVVSYYRTSHDCDASSQFSLLKSRQFQSWGWATWIDRFQLMCQGRVFDKIFGGYDYGVTSFQVRRRVFAVVPTVSRSKNIGAPSEDYYHQYLEVGLWSDDLPVRKPEWHWVGELPCCETRNKIVSIMASSSSTLISDFYNETKESGDTI